MNYWDVAKKAGTHTLAGLLTAGAITTAQAQNNSSILLPGYPISIPAQTPASTNGPHIFRPDTTSATDDSNKQQPEGTDCILEESHLDVSQRDIVPELVVEFHNEQLGIDKRYRAMIPQGDQQLKHRLNQAFTEIYRQAGEEFSDNVLNFYRQDGSIVEVLTNEENIVASSRNEHAQAVQKNGFIGYRINLGNIESTIQNEAVYSTEPVLIDFKKIDSRTGECDYDCITGSTKVKIESAPLREANTDEFKEKISELEDYIITQDVTIDILQNDLENLRNQKKEHKDRHGHDHDDKKKQYYGHDRSEKKDHHKESDGVFTLAAGYFGQQGTGFVENTRGVERQRTMDTETKLSGLQFFAGYDATLFEANAELRHSQKEVQMIGEYLQQTADFDVLSDIELTQLEADMHVGKMLGAGAYLQAEHIKSIDPEIVRGVEQGVSGASRNNYAALIGPSVRTDNGRFAVLFGTQGVNFDGENAHNEFAFGAAADYEHDFGPAALKLDAQGYVGIDTFLDAGAKLNIPIKNGFSVGVNAGFQRRVDDNEIFRNEDNSYRVGAYVSKSFK